MVVAALLCSQVILILWTCWLAARVRRLSWLASRATKRAQAPQMWESRQAELAAEVASLSSSFEKVATAVTRQNSRHVMQDRRAGAGARPPEIGASKAELRRYYGLQKSGPAFARAQLSLVPDTKE